MKSHVRRWKIRLFRSVLVLLPAQTVDVRELYRIRTTAGGFRTVSHWYKSGTTERGKRRKWLISKG